MKEAMLNDPLMFWQAVLVLVAMLVTTANNIFNPVKK
ncbi:hypothetical protein F4826_004799 [Rahnella inusitata]|nr:hypothetical protein [Rahnella inusitata]